MKILLLVQKGQRVILDRLYEAIADSADACDIRWLSSEEQANLRRYFKAQVDTERYDRIILFLRFKKEIKQIRFIRTVPNLVILEHDASQNYIDCKYQGKFSRHYAKLPHARVLVSGYRNTQRFIEEGVDAVFIPKGYDQSLLRNLGVVRDIELAFVGSTKNRAYSKRLEMLDTLAEKENLLITRTESGEKYLQTLNRIRFFVSADVGIGEYMIKNFEAMACGCVLLAWDQGEQENQALGFEDMKNIVLYESVETFLTKLVHLRANPEQAAAIAAAGQHLAESRYSWEKLGERIVQALQPPLPNPAPISKWWPF